MQHLLSINEYWEQLPTDLDDALETEAEDVIVDFLKKNPDFDININNNQLMNYAADRNFIDTMNQLLQMGALPSGDTIMNALIRFNYNLAWQLLKYSSVDIAHQSAGIMDFAIHPKSQNPEMIQFQDKLMQHPDFEPMAWNNHIPKKAIQADDKRLFGKILQHPKSDVHQIIRALKDANIDLTKFHDVHPMLADIDSIHSKFDL